MDAFHGLCVEAQPAEPRDTQTERLCHIRRCRENRQTAYTERFEVRTAIGESRRDSAPEEHDVFETTPGDRIDPLAFALCRESFQLGFASDSLPSLFRHRCVGGLRGDLLCFEPHALRSTPERRVFSH